MFFLPVKYDEPLFRPPSEAFSFILQATYGCSWNKCAFCEMYKSKKFSVKPEEELRNEIALAGQWDGNIRKVFLADGNAMVLSFSRLKRILDLLNEHLNRLVRVSAYCLPGDLENKSVSELKSLRDDGLSLIYVGIETGDDALLKLIGKGETFSSTVNNLLKAKEAGIKLSVMIINGLGGKQFSKQHALNSARIINAIQPEFLSTLVLSFPFGKEHFIRRFPADFEELNRQELLEELHLFISGLEVGQVVFRSDHASNYLSIKGILKRDQTRILNEIELAITKPEEAAFRQEWQRGL